MEEQSSEFTARPYQIDLYEQAVLENTIVYLPTGAGKTFIAILLLKKLSNSLQRSYVDGGKRSVMVVNSVALSNQHSDYIARHTGLACNSYNGDMLVDYWTKEIWVEQLNSFQVLVMTSQILVDLLNHGYISLSRINLIIFDECHSAVNDHPMRQIMKAFEMCPTRDQPKVLALSAILLNSNVDLQKIESTIESLEKTFHAKIATVGAGVCIRQYCTDPREHIIEYEEYIPQSTISIAMDSILDATKVAVKEVVFDYQYMSNASSEVFKSKSKNRKLLHIMDDVRELFLQTGVYGGSKGILLHLIQIEKIKKFCNNENASYVMEYVVSQLVRLRKMLDEHMGGCTELERIYGHSSDKILKLCAILKNFYINKLSEGKFCCIIFVQRRFTASVLFHVLKNLSAVNEEYKFVLPDYIVGSTNNPYKNAREMLCSSKWNKEALSRFRSGVSNCIIATEVIDEGIDIPSCTLIVRYDLPENIRAYIQSKGRARHKTSSYVLMKSTSNDQYMQKLKKFRVMEGRLNRILMGQTNIRTVPSQADIKEELYQHVIQPYTVTDIDGVVSVITEQSAIPLINHYCATLLKSKFCTLAAIWTLYEDKTSDKYRVSLKLPIISSIKEVIYGDFHNNINFAKRSAAMTACVKLHQMGEISDRLLVIDSNSVNPSDNHLFPNWIEENVDEEVDSAKIGTTKKKRNHILQHPQTLYGAFPSSDTILYLHILHMEPTYSLPKDNRHLAFYDLLKDSAGFAILSRKQMPTIPVFPIFMNVGELNVTVIENQELTLTNEEISKLWVFHSMLFSQVVPVIKQFMVFDSDKRDNSFIIAPVNAAQGINWEIINNYTNIERIAPSVPLSFKSSDYELALVTPSYRGCASIYIVTQVCHDITPQSAFPTDDFYSYTSYYKERHELNILDTHQPMLEVKPISTKINCIKPRSMKPGLSKRRRADFLEDFEEHLVPELCLKIHFPALYWLKATTLPSILHRITQYLVAEDLRITIVTETGLGYLSLKSNEKWPPIDVIEKEIDETMEPLLETTCDETIETCQVEPELNGPEIDVLNADVKQYSWSKEQEPSDLERDIEQIQLIDIEYYNHFMSLSSDLDKDRLKSKGEPICYVKKPTVNVPILHVFLNDNETGPNPVQIMQALTSKLGNDVFDLERLETLGDTFLKFIVSLYLYHAYPSYNEGRLTALKGKIVGNRNLYYCGLTKKIPGSMKVDEFIPLSNFIVPAYTAWRPLQKIILDNKVSPNVLYEISIPPEERLTGCISEETLNKMKETVLNWDVAGSHTGMEQFLGVQTVADKSVADAVEALIGTYLISMGLKGATRLLTWFEILPKSLNIDNLLYCTSINVNLSDGDPNVHMPYADSLEERIGYKFRNRALLLQAFTHPSYTPNNITECYQRLEFLGDAILDFLITCYIYETCGNLSPGALTDLRSALVNNITFACLAVRHGLHTALLSFEPKLSDIIDRFVKFQEERKHVIDDELLWILLEEHECNMAEYVDVPKILGDLYESLIGAIYLDSDKSLTKVWEIIYAFMHKEIDTFSKNVPKQPVRVIYETPGARANFKQPQLIEGTNTVMVPLQVMIGGKLKLFHGFGASKKQARCAAAKLALKRLRCNA